MEITYLVLISVLSLPLSLLLVFFQNSLPGGTSIAASLREKWVNSVKRKDFIPGEQHRVCSQHFHGP